MRKKSLVSLTCAALLALALTAPVWATPLNANGGEGVPRIGFVSEVLSWFLGLLPLEPQEDSPHALPAAGKGSGGSGGTATTPCALCIEDEIKSNIDPNG